MSLILHFTFFINLYAEGNQAARYEIDAKRAGVSPVDKDALPRSREFIRLDSTYYVGYMYEGLFRADKSSDYFGFKNAIQPLKKAFLLFEKDYGNNIRSMYTAPQMYMQYMGKYADFLQIANSLRECYDNIEMADSVMWLLDRMESYHFQKEHFSVYTYKAWTYHRNRFFTSSKYAFLKNSVAENEAMAFRNCYISLDNIERNKAKNDVWFGPGQAENDKLNVYHYLALLHCFNKNYDSSEYYYQKLASFGAVSWNNYGGMKHELGSFAVAYEYFNKDKYKYQEKMLREPYYFLPLLNVYAGRTKEAMALSKEAIEFSGSTPGFGWYNISLGRSYLYDGQLDSAAYVLNKAAEFKEIHIGTTLTQSQYEFTINMLKLQLIERKIQLVKFSNRGWWYSPSSLYKLAQLKIDKMLQQYILINQLSLNPERDRTVYDLFCSESTTTFDEDYYLIKDFSPAYFVKKYETYQKTDPRKNIQRYFNLISHQMQWADGKETMALEGYMQLIKEVTLDTANEKLFLGRLYEGMCKGLKEEDNTQDYNFYTNVLFEQYPQLVPFSGLKINMKLNTSGIEDEITKKVIKEIKGCNINWTDEADGNTPVANVIFNRKGDKYEAIITVKSGSDKTLILNEQMVFKKSDGVGKELALRFFNKGGATVWEKS